jgi:hypothetical protein
MAESSTTCERRKDTHRLPFFENPTRVSTATAGRLLAIDQNHLSKAFGYLQFLDQTIEARTVVEFNLSAAARFSGKPVSEIRK